MPKASLSYRSFSSSPLTSEFEGRFSQIFPCYVVRTPETIKIELYESSTRFRSPLAELYLPVPDATVTSENYKLQPFEFSSNVLRQYNPNQTTAIGAGIPTPIEIDDKERIYLNIEGILNAGIAWGVQDGVVLVPPDLPTSKALQKYDGTRGVMLLSNGVFRFQSTHGRWHAARHQHASRQFEQHEELDRMDQTIQSRSVRSGERLPNQSNEGKLRELTIDIELLMITAFRTIWARGVMRGSK